MAKVIMTIAPEDGMMFENIMSFQTENHIGIWDNVEEVFVLMSKSSRVFEPWYLYNLDDNGYFEDLKELDKAVYEKCEEHIKDVFDKCSYTIELD